MQKLENGSVMELYVRPEHPLPDHKDQLERANANAKLAQQMGANTLAALDVLSVTSATAAEWCKSQGLQPLTAKERSAWVEFLPTAYYTESNREVQHPRPDDTPWHLRMEIRNYQHHEGMPRHIRELFVKIAPLFSLLEIRTTETRDDHRKTGRLVYDPALFGHIVDSTGNRDTYLLARWGESDANFIRSFSDLKMILTARTGFAQPGSWLHRRLYGNPRGDDDSWFFNRFIATLGCGSIAFITSVFLQRGGPIPLESVILASMIGGSIPWLILLADRMKAQRRKKALAVERPDLVRFV